MPGLVPGIHVFTAKQNPKTWMAGTSPAMTHTEAAAQESYHMDPEFIRELFASFGPVTVKRLFGGLGISSDGLTFALVFDGAIFLKVDDDSIPDFEREGSRPFVYTRAKSKGRVGKASMSYWRLPERLYDDPDELAVWARRAFAIAERKKLAPRKRTRRKTASPL
jgi:DNA transformation protein and related proteins